MYFMSCILLQCKWLFGPFAFNKLIDQLIFPQNYTIPFSITWDGKVHRTLQLINFTEIFKEIGIEAATVISSTQ